MQHVFKQNTLFASSTAQDAEIKQHRSIEALASRFTSKNVIICGCAVCADHFLSVVILNAVEGVMGSQKTW